jgi:hypothetical protein
MEHLRCPEATLPPEATQGVPAGARPAIQNRAIWLWPFKAIQKWTPSLQTPYGFVPVPVEKVPSGVASAAFQ